MIRVYTTSPACGTSLNETVYMTGKGFVLRRDAVRIESENVQATRNAMPQQVVSSQFIHHAERVRKV